MFLFGRRKEKKMEKNAVSFSEPRYVSLLSILMHRKTLISSQFFRLHDAPCMSDGWLLTTHGTWHNGNAQRCLVFSCIVVNVPKLTLPQEMKTERVIIPVSCERESRVPPLKHLIPQDQLRRDSGLCVSPPLACFVLSVSGCKLRLGLLVKRMIDRQSSKAQAICFCHSASRWLTCEGGMF